MSRHILKSDGKTEVVVGWDHPMLTYFAHIYQLGEDGEPVDMVIDPVTHEEKDPTIRIGGMVREIYDLESFYAVLRRHGVTLSPALGATLYRDRDEGR